MKKPFDITENKWDDPNMNPELSSLIQEILNQFQSSAIQKKVEVFKKLDAESLKVEVWKN